MAASPTPAVELTRLTGTVLEKHAKSSDNWSRFKVQTSSGDRCWVTARFGVEIGETFDGECTFNSKYRSYDCVTLAVSEDGKVSNDVVTLKLVEVLDGVGKIKARRLSETFPDLYTAVVERPEEVAAAVGVDVEKVKSVSVALAGEHRNLSFVTELVNRGYPHHLAKKISKDDRAYKVAIESPYAAIKLVKGLGWLLADEIGRKQGVKATDPKRLDAGVDHLYREKISNDGHTIVHLDTLTASENLPSLLGVKGDLIREAIDRVLLARGDGWYTSDRHRENAQTIADFFGVNIQETPSQEG